MSQQPRSLQPLVRPALGACPFCGTELGEEDYSEAGVCRNATLQVFSLSPLISRWYVGCNTCGTTGPTKTNAELAIEAWNERGNRGRQPNKELSHATKEVAMAKHAIALAPVTGSAWFDILDAAESGLSNVVAPLDCMELPPYPAGGTCGIANLSTALKSITEAKRALNALRDQLAHWTAMNEAYGPVRRVLDGALTDTQIVDWLETNSLLHWPFGNEIQVSARCLAAVPFTARPTLREAVQAAITAQPNAKLIGPGQGGAT